MIPKNKTLSAGVPALDKIIDGLRIGDNVVWQADAYADYRDMASRFLWQSVKDGRDTALIVFSKSSAFDGIPPSTRVTVVDPEEGFDLFTRQIDRLLNRLGKGCHYVFDNLTNLLDAWATDTSLADFFRITCPRLYDLQTVSYFMLQRGRHGYHTIARIRDTTQVLLEMTRRDNRLYVHPLKAWDRYSPTMFIPHEVISPTEWRPCAVYSEERETVPLPRPSRIPTPWDSLYIKLAEYTQGTSRPGKQDPDIPALKQEMIRRVLGIDPKFIDLATRHLTLDDLTYIRERMIGTGRIGGKASGLILARRILLGDHGHSRFENILEEPDAFFLGADVFFTYLVDNNLFRIRLDATERSTVTRENYPKIEQRFLDGSFPENIIARFKELVQHFGNAPFIVRSSSLLEDSFGNAFAGKYDSVFCVNQGCIEERLDQLLTAVKRVYASVLNPDALTYRRRRGLLESEEQMAILIQRVSGREYKRKFFPPLAGVAFSRNLYAWSDRIDPHRGVIRLVFGLGTRAVNRVGGDYPRIIAISHPELRPEVGKAIAHYSQHEMEVLDLRRNELIAVPVKEMLADRDFPGMHLMISIMRDGNLFEPISRLFPEPSRDFVLTFANLVRRTNFTAIVGDMLERLEKAYGHPVDTEFTAFVDNACETRLNLLQCRPMWLPGATPDIEVPESLPEEQVLFRTNRLLCGGLVENLRYIIYVDNDKYAQCPSVEMQSALGRIIGRLNALPEMMTHRYLLIGPGRWGSGNPQLGVHVNYADITNAAVLVEVAREEAGHVPEVSYGTHFFLDLIEARIVYLPVYPSHPASAFNETFFTQSKNRFTELMPEEAPFAEVVRVIDVAQSTDGMSAHVVADSQTQTALCFLEKPGQHNWRKTFPKRAFGEKNLGFGF